MYLIVIDPVLEAHPDGQGGQLQGQQVQDTTGHTVEVDNPTGALATVEAEVPATVEVPRKTITIETPSKTITKEDHQDTTGAAVHHIDTRSVTFHYSKTIPLLMKVNSTLIRPQMVTEHFTQPCS